MKNSLVKQRSSLEDLLNFEINSMKRKWFCLECLWFEHRSSDFSSSSKFKNSNWRKSFHLMFDLKIICLKSIVEKEGERFLSVEDFLLFYNSTKRKVNSIFIFDWLIFQLHRISKIYSTVFLHQFFIDFSELKWKDLSTAFFSDKSVRIKKKCFVLFPWEKKRWLFSIDSSARDFVIGLSLKIDASNDLCFAWIKLNKSSE